MHSVAAHMDVEAHVALCLDVCLKVCHFKVVIHPVHHEVWEPRVFPSCLKQLVEEFEALLAEVVSEYFETHKGLVLAESLCEQSQPHVVNLIVSHVQVDQTLVYCDCLGDCFSSVVRALVVSQMQRFKRAVIAFKVLSDCLTTTE